MVVTNSQSSLILCPAQFNITLAKVRWAKPGQHGLYSRTNSGWSSMVWPTSVICSLNTLQYYTAVPYCFSICMIQAPSNLSYRNKTYSNQLFMLFMAFKLFYAFMTDKMCECHCIQLKLPYIGKFSCCFIFTNFAINCKIKFHESVAMPHLLCCPRASFVKIFLQNNWNCHFYENLVTQNFPVYSIMNNFGA